MIRLFLIPLLVAASLAAAAGQTVAENAEDAIRSGLPQAAIAPLQRALRQAPAAGKNELALLLARAQLAANRPQDALQTLDDHATRGAGQTQLLRAAAFAAQGSLEAAAELAAPLASEQPAAALLLARIRTEQGEEAAALALLPGPGEELPDDPNFLRLLLDLQLSGPAAPAAEQTIEQAREQNLLPAAELDTSLARLRLATGQASEAAELFGQVLTLPDLPSPVRDNARLGLARSLVALGVDARARDILYASIAEAPDAGVLRDTMTLWVNLENKLGQDPTGQLRSWAENTDNRRGFEAGLRLARVDLDGRNTEAAVNILEKLAARPDLEPADSMRVQLLLAEARVAAGRVDEARQILEDLPLEASEIDTPFRVAILRGRALAAAGQPRQACDAFAAALEVATTTEQAAAAATNGLLCALTSEDLTLARTFMDKLRAAAPTSPDLVTWTFLLATAEAREGDIDTLSALARSAPSAEYTFQSKLALAEWRLSRGEAAAAERILRTARDEAETPPRAAALAAAEIFAADNAGSRTRPELIEDCRAFLAAHPEAPEAADISFKLGELQARGGDHAAAESIFAQLADTLPAAESAALAKFLAAQAASRSMSAEGAGRALLRFDELAQSNSPLRHRARLEQATLLLRERRFADALVIYDGLLAASPPQDVRHAALMEKGDTLFALGAEEAERYPAAAAIYEEVARDTSAPADWRDQAACKRAAALARTGQIEAALATYREVLARPPGETADYFWFYKAGVEAGRLLEEQQDWSAAIAVYDLMASAGGPHREEIEQRSRRLRLEHFIWEN